MHSSDAEFQKETKGVAVMDSGVKEGLSDCAHGQLIELLKKKPETVERIKKPVTKIWKQWLFKERSGSSVVRDI